MNLRALDGPMAGRPLTLTEEDGSAPELVDFVLPRKFRLGWNGALLPVGRYRLVLIEHEGMIGPRELAYAYVGQLQ